MQRNAEILKDILIEDYGLTKGHAQVAAATFIGLKEGYTARGLYKNKQNPDVTISASTPIEVLYGAKELSKRQQVLLSKVPKELSRVILKKRDINVNDLAHLTAKTGDEFALFTRGAQRLLIRGNSNGVRLTIQQLKNLHKQGYKFSAHTHPGTSDIARKS
ncbi:hypothetical protein [Spartinivicinus poritis]|uniref:Uncharacterized protein n=1 Tax=Spartinivicinus poritis TaxID=2994640 RepID=A0ABT5UJZ2_9GAMM|nr:hypothetical protein [Spartinivicinus sp. A2-2]MDE1465718.1 hypothetical protein [Spartinivicinus sp. A2-2]